MAAIALLGLGALAWLYFSPLLPTRPGASHWVTNREFFAAWLNALLLVALGSGVYYLLGVGVAHAWRERRGRSPRHR
jgi:hypothetical protein